MRPIGRAKLPSEKAEPEELLVCAVLAIPKVPRTPGFRITETGLVFKK